MKVEVYFTLAGALVFGLGLTLVVLLAKGCL